MARTTGTSSSLGPALSRQSSFGRRHHEDEDETQAQAALLRNDSPSAQDPVPDEEDEDEDEDVERGSDVRFRMPRGADFQAWREWGYDVLGIADRGRRRDRDVDRDR
jgi:hypothetical protein